jgi:hypothetical protein
VRINVYSQELTDEVLLIEKKSNIDITYRAVQFVLHSSPMLHHPPEDDDRSAVTFWLPQSVRGLESFQRALKAALFKVDQELYVAKIQAESRDKVFNRTYEANAARRGQYDEAPQSEGGAEHG